MKRVFLTLIMGVLAACPAYAQDPGSPDSVIVEDTVAALGDTVIIVNISVVSDDPVAFFNLPLEFYAPLGGFSLDSVRVVSDPPVLSLWDEVFFDFVESDGFLRMFGFWDTGGDDNPPMNTENQRIRVLNLVFRVEPDAPDQYVSVGQAVDSVGGPIRFGLSDGLTGFAPAFVPGEIRYGNPTGIGGDEGLTPDLLLLRQNFPNPFNPTTTIGFYLPRHDHVTLTVYNLSGQRVRRLADGMRDPGDHVVIWDGKNDAAMDVPSGIYFCKMTAGVDSRTAKMVLVR